MAIKPTTAIKEHDIQNAILELLAVHPKVAWAHRMNSGAFKVGPRFIKCGFTGCPDIMGQLKDGRFLAIEVKKPGGKLTKEQNEFITMVNMNKGFGIIATDAAQVAEALK